MTAKIPIIRTGKRKTCTKCGDLKFLREFSPSKNRKNHPDGHDYWCRECRREYMREEYRRIRKKPDGIFYCEGRIIKKEGCARSIYFGEQKTKDFIRKYPTTTNDDLAVEFGCSPRTIVRRARALGLEKDPEWMKDVHDANLAKMIRQNKICPHYDREAFLAAGEPHRFRKGHDNGLTHEQRSENMRKAWKTRRRNMRRKKYNEQQQEDVV